MRREPRKRKQNDDEQERARVAANFPWYYGYAFDKLIVGFKVAFLWLATIPLIIYAILRTVVLYILIFAALIVPLILAALIGIVFFGVALYWTPSISIAVTQLAPLIAAGVEIGAFVLTLGWTIMIVLIDLWDILAPLAVVFFIYFVHIALTVLHEIIDQLTSDEITSLFNHLIEISTFFADVITITLTTLISLLPAALKLTIQVLQPLLKLLFKVMPILLDAMEFLLIAFIKIFPPILMAVVRLVKFFSSLLRSVVPLPSDSSRYSAGVDGFFNTLVQESEGRDYQHALDLMDRIARGQQSMIDYSHVPDPLHTSRARSDTSARRKTRGSLLERWHESNSTRHERRGADDLYLRADRAFIIGSAVSEGFHAMMDTAAPAHAHLDMMTDAFDRLAHRFGGFSSARQAIKHYHTRYGHPARWLAHQVPDLYGSWLGRAIRESNPDDPANKGMSHHEWRRAAYPPVSGHPNEEQVNRMIRDSQPDIIAHDRKLSQQTRDATVDLRDPVTGRKINLTPVQTPNTGIPDGEVPLPFEIPVVIGSNCYTSTPKFILCIPRPKPRRFKAPEILIPTNLAAADTCVGFIPPPDINDGWRVVLREMFNPITAVRNTWTYARYILSSSSGIFYSINRQTVASPWLGRFFSLFALNDLSDRPLQLEQMICLIIYPWYPYYVLLLLLLLPLLIPLVWLVISVISYIAYASRRTIQLVRGLLLYYNLTAGRVEVLDERGAVDVAQQKWWRERSVIRDARGRAETQPGTRAHDVVGDYERMRSNTYTEERVESDLNTMDSVQLLGLYTVQRDLPEWQRLHDRTLDQMNAMVNQLHVMGALSPHVRSADDARRHMSVLMRAQPLASHTSTLAHVHDTLHNVEVALGHRPLEDAVPLAA